MEEPMITISIKNVDMTALNKSVEDRHDWCRIEDIGGDYELGIYLATFTDDYRFVFEANEDRIRLMLTEEQMGLATNKEEIQQTLETILRYFLWSKG